jgi:hypothetical protein
LKKAGALRRRSDYFKAEAKAKAKAKAKAEAKSFYSSASALTKPQNPKKGVNAHENQKRTRFFRGSGNPK